MKFFVVIKSEKKLFESLLLDLIELEFQCFQISQPTGVRNAMQRSDKMRTEDCDQQRFPIQKEMLRYVSQHTSLFIT